MKKHKFEFWVYVTPPYKGLRTMKEAWDIACDMSKEYAGDALSMVSLRYSGKDTRPNGKYIVPVYTFTAKYRDKEVMK